MKLIITDIEHFKIPVGGDYKVIMPQGTIHHCTGCFGCWVKTPGKCVIHDGYEGTGTEMGKCTELILVSQCCYGSVSPFVKTVQDRAISYIHPDFVLRKGRCTTNADTKMSLHYPHIFMGNTSQSPRKRLPGIS